MARIYVINPWCKEWEKIDLAAVTQEDLDTMVMDEKVVEQIRREGSAQSPGEFFRRYVEIVGPEAGGCAWFL